MKIFSMVSRYLAIIILSLSLPIFYLVLAPLTAYPVYWILSLFYEVSLEKTTLIVNGSLINLIDACIAGSAYFLLAILNLSTPKIKGRIKVFLFCASLFLIMNILRIVILAALFLKDFAYFNQLHLLTWYFLTALFVVFIWIITIKTFEIKEIPFYSDFIVIRKLLRKK